MPLLSFTTITLIMSTNFIPSLGQDIGNLVDAINNKYNTFSLIEILMDNLDGYLQLAYKELKDILAKKFKQTTKCGGNTTALKLGATSRTLINSTTLTNLRTFKNSSQNYKQYNIAHLTNISTLTGKPNHTADIPKNGHPEVINQATTNQHSTGCQNLDKSKILGNLVKNQTGTFHVLRNNRVQNPSVKTNGNSSNKPTVFANASHNGFIDEFLNSKILNYYKNLRKKYANTSAYDSIKTIVDAYFKQFKEEIHRLENNMTSDVKVMKSNLIELYYETTSTTECVDSVIVHYIENRTSDLERYVKNLETDVKTVLHINNKTMENRASDLESYVKNALHLTNNKTIGKYSSDLENYVKNLLHLNNNVQMMNRLSNTTNSHNTIGKNNFPNRDVPQQGPNNSRIIASKIAHFKSNPMISDEMLRFKSNPINGIPEFQSKPIIAGGMPQSKSNPKMFGEGMSPSKGNPVIINGEMHHSNPIMAGGLPQFQSNPIVVDEMSQSKVNPIWAYEMPQSKGNLLMADRVPQLPQFQSYPIGNDGRPPFKSNPIFAHGISQGKSNSINMPVQNTVWSTLHMHMQPVPVHGKVSGGMLRNRLKGVRTKKV
ncbi:origin recognition complex subunit 1-like [Diaphorina citri]|uniref:Origin recognition complex subunit 1-like n=1 Tax=Diaphorina citri TaxID=121845 RepID=A0A1S3D9V6_DIACI|nr:origin recognition complex subunit 1-like [Diaphorina citri]